MNYKSKTALCLLSALALTACNDDNTTSAGVTPPVTPPEAINLTSNGDFEYWPNSYTPESWTLIDGGLDVTQSKFIHRSGSSSASIEITKAKEDFRQSIDVVAGKEYNVSVWVYHTEGYTRTRLYAGNYIDLYSKADLVNQWQEIKTTYKATTDGSIEVGARFYTDSGYDGKEIVYMDDFVVTEGGESGPVDPDPVPTPPALPTLLPPIDTATYYNSATGTGYVLKTELHNIIKDHTARTYTNLWAFMLNYSLDTYAAYDNDGKIFDMYSENPSASDSYNFTAFTDQCGNYSGEGSCYNREHSMPKSWFKEGKPMHDDIHHVFATDGYVNGRRGNDPFGEVGTSSWTSNNGSKLGSPTATLIADGFTGDTVFEPIDEFKGDFARAYFYMATRYQDVIGTWSANSANADAVFDGSSDKVFEDWVLKMLKTWHANDPVSAKERDRNDNAATFQGNRNPFVDHPEYVSEIWGN